MPTAAPQALADALDHLQAGRGHAAEEILRGALPDPACLARLREYLLAERRNADVAEVLTQAALDDSADAWVNRAVSQHLDGEFDAATVLCRRALSLDASHAPALNHLGRALHNLGRGVEAIDAFRAATAADPGYAEAWHSLGQALRAQGDFAGARSALRRALDRCPALTRARLDLGIVHQAMDEVDIALSHYRELLRLDPDHVEALLNSGLAHQLIDDTAAASRCYEQVLELEPRHQTALYYFGSLLNAELKTAAALRMLERALKLDPTDADVWFEIVAAHEQEGRLEEAGKAVQAGLDAAAGHPGLLIQAATIDRRAGRHQEALGRLQQIDARQLPGRIALLYFQEMGTVLDGLGQADPAMEAFRIANQLAARSPRQRDVKPERFHQKLHRMGQWVEAGANLPALTDAERDEGADLCFVVGFPGSGCSLLERMLDASPQVQTVRNGHTLEHAIDLLDKRPSGYPAVLPTLDGATRRDLRRAYRERLAAAGVDPAAGGIIVDALPLRLVNAPLIQTLFPAARLLVAQRHPCDVILGNYMRHYAADDTYSNFLEFNGCVRTYSAVMTLWRQLRPQLSLRMETAGFEALLDDPEASVSEVCGFLGITPTPAMLEVVQQPGPRDLMPRRGGNGSWQRYRRFLEPHLKTLGLHADFLDYGLD